MRRRIAAARASAGRKPTAPSNIQAAFQRAARALRVSRRCNQILVRADTESVLLSQVCAGLVNEGGYRMAWVGLAEDNPDKHVRPVAHFGLEDGYLERARITWNDSERGRGPVGKAVRSGTASICRFIADDPDFAPWRNEALKRGYQSLIALPLKMGMGETGVMAIYASEPDAFDRGEVDLLREMADDLTYGITALRGRSARRQAEEALQAEQRLLANLMSVMPDHIYFKDRQSRFVRANEAMMRRFGLTDAGQLLGKTDFDVFSEEHARQAFEDEQRIMNTGEALIGLEEKETWPDGHVTWVSTTKVPLKDGSGEVIGIVGISRDITERKRAEDERRLQSAALNAAANAIIITDRAGNIQAANPSFTALTGYSLAEVIGRNPRDLIKSGQHNRDFYRQLWETVLAGGVWSGEMINRRKDGSTFTEEMTVTPVRSDRGDITHFVAIKQDVTERKAALERIRQQAALLDQASDAIYVSGTDGIISYWNEGAERIFGWSRGEALGRRLGELKLTDYSAADHSGAVLLERGSWAGERQQVTKGNARLDVFVRLSVVKDAQGRASAIFAITTDITEKKQVEARLLQAQRLEGIGALAGGIAHDLNNVLSPILMGTPLLREAVHDPAALSLLDLMAASATRGADIVKQVLTFARGSEGHRAPLQLRHLLRDMVKMAEETFPKNIRIHADPPPDLWMVEADATQMHQVMLNLCINARDAMPDGGTLTLDAANVTLDDTAAARTPGLRPGPCVRLRVTDTGSGIPEEIRGRIFEPFFTTKAPGKGTGLGLSTALGIVRSHGGFIGVVSEVGKGATFELILPALPGAQPHRKRHSAPPVESARGERVLLVDDEAAVREVVRQVLEQFGYQVAVCSSGAEAIDIFRSTADRTRLVVTDMMMPEMDGPELVRALRRLAPGVPVIGITGVTDQETTTRLNELGLSALVAKPFTINQLLNSIHEVLGRTARPPP